MRSGSCPLLALAALAIAGCGSSSHPAPFQATPGDNVLAVSVDGSHCGSSAYLNQPCVSVKICEPGTATCQTVDDVLLDTGSFGLRVFKQVLTVSLPAVPAPGGGSLAECVQFADMTADWGPVESADVVLANEPAVRVPIQVIDSTFGSVPSSCPNPETAPSSIKGILGVGVFVEDCGAPCPAQANMYFASNGSTTTAVTVDPSSQVQNPVAALPSDNNGLIVTLPSVPAAGAPSVDGAVVLGLGTRPNNSPTQASAIALDGRGDFSTTLSGGSPMAGSFADTGSNGLFFAPSPAIPSCTDHPEWFCPPSTLSFSATNGPSPGFPGNHLATSFQIGNFDALVVQPSNGHAVFAQIGGSALSTSGFIWGLPFFLGRTVYLGIAGRQSAFGPGPNIAY
jgi:hypothetical protein